MCAAQGLRLERYGEAWAFPLGLRCASAYAKATARRADPGLGISDLWSIGIRLARAVLCYLRYLRVEIRD